MRVTPRGVARVVCVVRGCIDGRPGKVAGSAESRCVRVVFADVVIAATGLNRSM